MRTGFRQPWQIRVRFSVPPLCFLQKPDNHCRSCKNIPGQGTQTCNAHSTREFSRGSFRASGGGQQALREDDKAEKCSRRCSRAIIPVTLVSHCISLIGQIISHLPRHRAVEAAAFIAVVQVGTCASATTESGVICRLNVPSAQRCPLAR